MKLKHLFIPVLALLASTVAQSDDELHIPVENDNQFPPDNPSEVDGVIEGSGAGVIEEPLAVTTESISVPILDDLQSTLLSNLTAAIAAASEEHKCPKPCVCNIEGDSNKYIVDCSGYELTELPKPIDPKTTELNLQNNKLTEISKDISALKNLKILNANNNQIMEVISGSISELPELTSLKLGNNRLIEYPQDLKNSFGLTKLEELDLSGNDMRTDLKSETFSNFQALRKLVLPTASSTLVQDLCSTLKNSLETVCTGSCDSKAFDCPDAPANVDGLDSLLDFALPSFIAISTGAEDNADPAVAAIDAGIRATNVIIPPIPEVTDKNNDNATSKEETSIRAAVNKAPIVETTSNVEQTADDASKTDGDVAVGAATEPTKGGVDKTVIGVIVAGMVLVVAGITIKKNWSSIKNRFNSSPRTANESVGATANGTSPEEVPLQEKSPV